jgi:hypothetical protein
LPNELMAVSSELPSFPERLGCFTEEGIACRLSSHPPVAEEHASSGAALRKIATHFLRLSARITLIAAAVLLMGRRPATPNSLPHLGSFIFQILNADGTEVVGHNHYDLSRGEHNLLIGRGAASFNDGQNDVEYDTMVARPGQLPLMLTFEHKFYNADGSIQRVISADFAKGEASCTRYENGIAHTDTAKLDFTPDSYGGSAVILPLEQYLAQHSTEPLKLRALNCIPKPRLIAVEARIRQPSHWSHYPGETVEVDITPDLGWLDVVIAPLLPRLRAWFDPAKDWAFAGGEFSRYFRGPRIMLVRQDPSEPNEKSKLAAVDKGRRPPPERSTYH